MTLLELKEANRKMRAADESHLWPISGKFNATERAIRRIRKAMAEGLCFDHVEEYEGALDQEISEIVNDEDNW